MKNLFRVSVLILFVTAPCFGAPDRTEPSFDSRPTYDSMGNVERDFGVALSTKEWVLISSSAVNATGIRPSTQPLNIEAWMFREIVNVSSCAALTLLAGGHPYATFISSFGVKLSSDSTGLGAGDSYVPPGQDEYWGIWTSASGDGSCASGAGAAVHESYYDERRRR